MTIADAQQEMRDAYWWGAPGMFASATAWLVAAVVALGATPERSVWALFIGGMLIHPVGLLLLHLAGRPAKHSRDNPLGKLALESTVWMLLCLPLAYALSRYSLVWFFPAALLVIGGRYFTFATMYGVRTYWICGAALAGAGYVSGALSAAPATAAFVGAAIECVFATLLLVRGRHRAAT